MSSKGTYVRRTTDWGIVAAFAERLGYAKTTVSRVGALQLCLCRSDEARRILLSARKKHPSQQAEETR